MLFVDPPEQQRVFKKMVNSQEIEYAFTKIQAIGLGFNWEEGDPQPWNRLMQSLTGSFISHGQFESNNKRE